MVYSRIIIYSVFLIVFITFSVSWALVFLRRIYCCRKYRRGAARCLSDNESGYVNKELCYHFETESWKYTLLLVINLCECLSSIIVLGSYTVQACAFNHHLAINNTNDLPYNECISYNRSALKQINIDYMINPYVNGLTSVGRSVELFVVVFVVSLINYLITRIKRVKHSYNTLNYRMFLILTTLLSVVIILTGFVQVSIILSIVIFHISSIIYFCIFVHTTKRFKCALLQRALERLIQYGSNKEEMKQYKYFKFTINIICCGFVLIIVSEVLLQIFPLVNSALFYGKCYFPFNLLPSFQYVIQSEEVIEDIFRGLQLLETIGRLFCFIAVVLTASPFFLLSICIVINKVLKCIKGRKKIKYTTVSTSLESPLLVNQLSKCM